MSDSVDVLSVRYQQVYGASDFTGLGSPILITDLIFEPGPTPGITAALLPNVQITVSITPAGPDSLSPVFANNIGMNETLVFSGLLGFRRDPLYNFLYHIGFTTPFVYDPRLGNLLLDVRNFQTDHAPGPAFQQIGVSRVMGDTVSRMFSGDVNAPSGVGDTGGLWTTFIVTPIPEPGTALVLVLGLIGGGYFWYSQRCRRTPVGADATANGGKG